MDEVPIRAIEMVRSIRDQLHEETKRMTPEQFKEFVTTEAGKMTRTSAPIKGERPAA